jgi:hypothetical protein
MTIGQSFSISGKEEGIKTVSTSVRIISSELAKELEEIKAQEGTVTVYDSFATPDADGFSLDFISKNRTNDSIRRNFLSKLTYQKIWLTPLDKPKLHETAIIFDWDDTLLCTSFISPNGYYEPVELNPTAKQQIK